MASSQLAWRFVAGGSVVVIVSWLARGKHPLLAGLFVLFPAVTLVSFYFLAQNASPDTMRRIALFSIYSLPTTLAFLATFYLSQHRMSSIFRLWRRRFLVTRGDRPRGSQRQSVPYLVTGHGSGRKRQPRAFWI